ncbi:MAG: hypothetical protein HYW02_08685 [Deltaproteobacteria bacterium]|nr:hypothetical protein [Deltaproteobacteria bacterium]
MTRPLLTILTLLFFAGAESLLLGQVQEGPIACKEYDCIEKAIQHCTPATYPFHLGLLETTAKANLEITGKKEKICQVKLHFSLEEEVTCQFDPSASRSAIWYHDVLQKCKGPVFNVLFRKEGDQGREGFKGIAKKPSSVKGLKLEIHIPKKEYRRGEPMEGGFYSVHYSDEPFVGVLMVSRAKKGIQTSGDQILKKVVGQGEIFESLSPFYLLSGGYLESDQPFFREEGRYSFSLTLYDCATLEEKFKKDCDSLEIRREELEVVRPLKAAKKDILVKGKIDSFQCGTAEDCTAACENCQTDKPLCDIEKGICVDCLLMSDCKDRFKCDLELRRCLPLAEGECRYDGDCPKLCEACERGQGKQWCYQPIEESPPYQCVECVMDMNCKKGYRCKEQRCVQ